MGILIPMNVLVYVSVAHKRASLDPAEWKSGQEVLFWGYLDLIEMTPVREVSLRAVQDIAIFVRSRAGMIGLKSRSPAPLSFGTSTCTIIMGQWSDAVARPGGDLIGTIDVKTAVTYKLPASRRPNFTPCP
jgi:hypothetical protein